jgi:hypothetical protein
MPLITGHRGPKEIAGKGKGFAGEARLVAEARWLQENESAQIAALVATSRGQ